MSESMIAVLAPPLDTKSGGIVCLHKLYTELRFIDPRTKLLLYKGIGNQFLVEVSESKFVVPEELNNYFPNTIFIVPEVLCGSRLMGLRIARYYLNKLGAVAPAKADVKTEFAITFNTAYCPKPFFYLPQFLGKPEIPDSFRSAIQSSKPINCTYYGKNAGRYENAIALPSSILITRSWPENPDHYLELLRLSEYFFSFDSVSSSNSDALLLGNKVVLLDFHPNTESIFNKIAPEQPYLTAENYASPEALEQYVEKCDQWLQGLRETKNNFDILVEILHESLNKFFRSRT